MRVQVSSAVACLLAAAVSVGCTDRSQPDPEPAPTQAAPQPLSAADLEAEVERRYPPAEQGTKVWARCAGDLPGEVGATQRCRVRVARDRTDVLVEVVSVDDGSATLETVPLVPPDEVAATLHASLTEEGYDVDTVTCAGDLVGRVGEKATCTAEPSRGKGTVRVRVARVEGLDVRVDYELGRS